MIRLKVEDVEGYLGKPVNDPYGRRVGFIIGFYSDSDGNVTSLEVSLGDFEFKEISIDRFELDNGNIVLIPEWEYKAKIIENRLQRLRKRMIALNELFSKKEVPKHVYEEFKKKVEDELVKTKEDAKNVRELLKKRLNELEDIMLELEKAMTSIKVSYLAGEIPEKAYREAADQIRKHMEYTELERESLRKHLDKIDSLEKQPLGLPAKTEAKQDVSGTEQSLPVVVLEA
ncbi:MAG: CdvA-like protein [Thermoprotei archaeon]